MSDISVDVDRYRVNIRAACILRSEKHVLLCQTIGEKWWFVPGGRVRAGESFAEALARELREEIGCAVDVGACIAIAEGFFRNDGHEFHEIGAYFNATLRADRRAVATRFENEERVWVPVETADHLEIYPQFLRSMIADPPSTVQHITFRE